MSMTVGGTQPKFTYTSTGLVNGDSLATEPKLACTADGSVAGTYSIVPSGADAGSNYEITYVNGTLTIYSRSSGGGSSSSGSSYTVSVPSAKNGDVTVSPKNASKGDRVTVTVKPDSGYVLETLTVTDKNGNELTLKDKGSGKYTFTMPAGKVEVKATCVKAGETSPFVDVPTDSYYFDAVKWAQKLGITNGFADGTFGVNSTCTRGQSVTFLYRAMIRRISVDTILNAKKGDESAIQTILNYYKGYMLELCKFELYDASGKIYVCYDEDLYQELQFKLIKEIQNRFELS